MQCVLNNGVVSIDVRTVSCFVRKVVYNIKHKKRTGPRCDPWGTPAVTECFAEDEEPTRTDILVDRFER